MSSDIVKQLRARVSMTERLTGHKGDGLTLEKAADRIEALERENAALKFTAAAAFKTIKSYMDEAARREDGARLESNRHNKFLAAQSALVECMASDCDKAIARAERLLEILNEIAGYADDRPGSWAAMRARKALEDDKQ